MMTSDTGMVYH